MHLTVVVLVTLLAQDAAPAEGGEAKVRAQALLSQGAQHYQRSEFAAALDKFEQAYGLFPSPKLLFNMGQASRELGRPVEAIDAFERFLAHTVDSPAELAVEARRSVAELSEKLGKLLIECTVTDAEISVDGKRIGQAPVAQLVRVLPGSHQVTATHPGTTPAIETVVVAAGTVQTVVMRPRTLAEVMAGVKVASASEPVVAREAALALPPSPDSQGGWLGRKWTWVAVGSSLVLTAGAATAGLAMQARFAELDGRCGSSAGTHYTGCSSGDLDALNLRRNAANVLWGLAAASGVTAGILFFVERGRVTLSPVAGPTTGLLARVRY
jgi:hypothetical protein